MAVLLYRWCCSECVIADGRVVDALCVADERVFTGENRRSETHEKPNSVTVRVPGSDSEFLAREARFGVRRFAKGRIRHGELDAAFGKTLRLAFPLRISKRHGVGRGAGVTHRGRGCVSTEPISMRGPNTR